MHKIYAPIKLVIWDLDETFWRGTLSEEGVEAVSENIALLRSLVERGIMNAISSKNDFGPAKEKLVELGVFDLFIFPRINWDSKGRQIEELIADCQLRAQNVLFIDDNVMNLREAVFYNEALNVTTPDALPSLLENKFLQGNPDPQHSRLAQYKILEAKKKDAASSASNAEFLRSSNIRVEIKTDCHSHLDRLYDLISRANQLNFTKQRLTYDELSALLETPEYDTGYVTVSDNYGDYGIVGFYARQNNSLPHFVFSCRAMGIGVEQWVYSALGFPELQIVGEVASSLSSEETPSWINMAAADSSLQQQARNSLRILLRGGCDLSQMSHYLEGAGVAVDCEFNSGSFHRDHTVFMRGCLEYSDGIKKYLTQNISLLAENTYETAMFEGEYDIVVYSVLMDYTQNVYHHKTYPEMRIAYGNFTIPVPPALQGSDREEDRHFLENYVPEGCMTPDEFLKNLQFIRDRLPQSTSLILINGSEIEKEHLTENQRDLHHRHMNSVVDHFVANNTNTYLLDVRRHAKTTDDVTDNIRHYKRHVYFLLAKDFLRILNDISKEKNVKNISRHYFRLTLVRLKDFVKGMLT